MAYLIGWLIYLAMAVLLLAGFERYLAGYIRLRQRRIFCRSVLALGLLTPGLAQADGRYYLVPACIEVLFNLLAHSYGAALKAALPLLLASTLVFAGLFVYETRCRDRDGDGDGPPEREEPSL
ncbi:MAG: hypothetical protein ACOY41_12800 [Pseudomonadota bacterium]